jgi:LysM repeat protein
MAASGTPFEAARACPFVALELDRDRRADKPDYRHRCFAEPTPAPRSIAHQEAYCLSPNFPGCPVFQDWAVRAAARPVGGAAPGSTSGPALVGGAVAAAAGAAAAAPSTHNSTDGAASPDVSSQTGDPGGGSSGSPNRLAPEDISMSPAAATAAAAAAASTGVAPGTVSPPTFATTGWQGDAAESGQLGAFDAPTSDADASQPAPEMSTRASDWPGSNAASPAAVSPAAGATTPNAPAFLAARSSRAAAGISASSPTGNTLPPRQAPNAPPIRRDDIVPSWQIDSRYGAEGSDEPGGSRLDAILTAIAVIAILGLGVAAVLFLPGLLSHGGATARTPAASFVAQSVPPSGFASVAPTLAASPASIGPTIVPATSAVNSAAPVGSPLLYKIKTGDTLAHIAAKFGLAVTDILTANPSIADPNSIQVGQIITIPTVAAASASP